MSVQCSAVQQALSSVAGEMQITRRKQQQQQLRGSGPLYQWTGLSQQDHITELIPT